MWHDLAYSRRMHSLLCVAWCRAALTSGEALKTTCHSYSCTYMNHEVEVGVVTLQDAAGELLHFHKVGCRRCSSMSRLSRAERRL